jgi:hypothetical protein
MGQSSDICTKNESHQASYKEMQDRLLHILEAVSALHLPLLYLEGPVLAKL